MSLAFEDVQTGAVYRVGEGGAVLGRDRARTDVAFRDESISKRHARIYAKDGRWYLEDLDSSNGTYVRNERVFEAALLREGVPFSLAQRRFRVVVVDGEEASDTDRQVPRRFGSAFVDAARFYLSALPRLAFVPIGFVRAQVDEPAAPGGGEAKTTRDRARRTGPELAVFGAIGGAIAASWAPLFEVGLAFAADGAVSRPASWWWVPAGAAAGAVAGALVHPVAPVVIRALGGVSDVGARSRLALTVFAAAALLALPASAAARLASLDPVLVTAVSAAVGLWGIGVVMFAAFRWGRVLGVYRWVEIAVLVVGLLVLAGGSASALRALVEESGPRFVDGAGAGARPPRATVDVPADVVRGTAASAAQTPFAQYARERAWIESTLDSRPRLLEDRDIHDAYQALLAREAEIDRSTAQERRGEEAWYEERIARRLRSLRRFESTRDSVSSLARRIRRRVESPEAPSAP